MVNNRFSIISIFYAVRLRVFYSGTPIIIHYPQPCIGKQRKCDWAEVIARTEVRLIFMKFLWVDIGRMKKLHTGKPLDISSIGSGHVQ